MALQTYIVQIDANENTIKFYKSTLEEQANAYNQCANIIRDQNIPLNIKDIHKAVYETLRHDHPTLPAQSIIKTYKSVLSAYRSIKSNGHDAETPQKHSLSMVLDKRLYDKLDVTGVSLTGEVQRKRTRYGFVMYDKARSIFEKYKPCDPTLFMRNDRLYLSIPFRLPEQPVTSDESVGVDLGMKRLFTTSEGVAFRDKAYLKARRKIRYLKSCLKSKGTKSARKHLRKVRRREANLSKEMQYRAVNALLNSTSAGVIILEDLSKIKQKTGKTAGGFNRKRHNNGMSQVPFYGFKMKLEAKAPLYGKKVETVNPAFTSQTDSRSGKRDGNRKGCRYYCNDGVVLDADWNAAVNIAKKGKHLLSNPCPVDGRIVFLGSRAQSIARTCVNPDRVNPVGSHKPSTSVVGS